MKHYRQRANPDPVQAIELNQPVTTELGRASFEGRDGDILVIHTVDGKQYLTICEKDNFDEIFCPLDEQDNDDDTIQANPDGDNDDVCSEDTNDLPSESEMIDEEYNEQLESMLPDQPRKNPYTKTAKQE